MSTFPVTSVTLIAKIRNLAPGDDSAAWVRFWNSYSDAIRQFAALKGGEENADDIVMTVLGKLVDVLRNGQYTPEKGKFHSYLATMIVNEVHMSHRREIARASDRKVSIDSSVPGGAAESAQGPDAVGDGVGAGTTDLYALSGGDDLVVLDDLFDGWCSHGSPFVCLQG